MDDLRTILQQGLSGVSPPPSGYERLLRRRDRKRRRQRITAGVVGIAVALLALAGGAAILRSAPRLVPSQPTPTVANSAGSYGDLYAVDPTSGAVTPLAILPGDQWGAERSPVGDRMVYVTLLKGLVPQIEVLEPDGTRRQLTFFDRGALDPTWSPDGSQIAFARRGPEGGIYVVDAEGGRPRQLPGTGTWSLAPDWSPDGRTIAFNGARGVNTIPVSGGGPTPLTAGPPGYDPAWSPDGRWIAYTRPVETGNPMNNTDEDLWLIRTDNSHAYRLVDGGPRIQSAAWSPDGTEIAVIEDEIAIVDVAAGRQRILDGTHGWQAQVFPLGQERWKWIGATSVVTWDARGLVTAYATGPEGA